MNTLREDRLAKILLAALDVPESRRRGFLEQQCGGDAAMLREVLDCLAAEEQLGDFLETPAFGLGGAAAEWVDGAGSPEEGGQDTDPGAERTEVAGAPSWPLFEQSTLPEGMGRRVQPAGSPRPQERDGGVDASTGPEDAAQWQLPFGRRRLGAYPIVGHLGAGGMGQVFIGEDERLRRRVAIKVLPVEMAHQPGWLERFEREALALGALNHPNIVTIHSIEEDDGVRFLTMELVEGETLAAAIGDDGFGLENFLRFALELTDALVAAHERGVVHRDLKPANVMLTQEGRVKILDFGIAKMAAPDRPAVSKEGMLLGTVSFMSPEQLQGLTADARSDLFSLGIILYLMATGRHPFPASSMIERMSTILEREPAPVEEVRSGLPRELGMVIERCLEKDPDSRYQSAAELRADLDRLRERRLAEKLFESRTDLQVASPREKRPHWRIYAAGVVFLVTLTAFLGKVVTTQSPAGGSVEASQGERRKLGVLFFHNLTENPELDWLETGIANLLATDLSQSPDLQVVGLREIAKGAGELEGWGEAPLATEQLREAARGAGVEAVVRGSFARLGETLSVSFSVEQPAAGQVLAAASFEGRGENSMFGLVDQVSAAVLESLEATEPDIAPRSVEEVTTGSSAAWQAYHRARELYMVESRTEEAIGSLEEALRLDPDFALALLDLARLHQSQGRSEKARAIIGEAVERSDRLPLARKFDAEGSYYGARWATLGRSIETLKIGLKLYPDAPGWRNNLARRYAFFERYDEAIQEFEKRIASGADYWGDAYGLANARAALGDYESGYRLLTDYVASHEDNGLAVFALAWHLTEWGRHDEADATFARLSALMPDSFRPHYGQWRLQVLREDWDRADAEARRLAEFDGSFPRWRSAVSLARNALFRGEGTRALAHLAGAIEGSQGADRALARCFGAELHLARGEAGKALEAARLAQEEGAEQWPELRAIFFTALAMLELGRTAEAESLREVLQERWRRQPNAVEERQISRLGGLIALAREDFETAASELRRAASLLPPRGVEFSWHVFPPHVPIWLNLAEAELGAGRPKEALQWLARATSSGAERLEQPISFVLSHYLEGLAHHRDGDREAARRAFERFLDSWGDGDLYPDRVALARSYLEDAR